MSKKEQEQIIMELIAIAHELDWAFFWNDRQRNLKARKRLEVVKTLTNWREKMNQ